MTSRRVKAQNNRRWFESSVAFLRVHSHVQKPNRFDSVNAADNTAAVQLMGKPRAAMRREMERLLGGRKVSGRTEQKQNIEVRAFFSPLRQRSCPEIHLVEFI